MQRRGYDVRRRLSADAPQSDRRSTAVSRGLSLIVMDASSSVSRILFCWVALTSACSQGVTPQGDGASDVIDASDARSPDDGALLVRPSTIRFAQVTYQPSMVTTLINGMVHDPEPPRNPYRYVAGASGPCTWSTSLGAVGASAGSVSVDAGFTVAAGIDSTLSDMNVYDALFMGSLWPPGTHLSIRATGDVVPGFSAQLTMPPAVMITQPAPTSQAVVQVPGDADFLLTWMPLGQPFTVRVDASTSIPLSSQVSTFADVHCTFDGSQGTGTIPADVMGKLRGGQGTLFVGAHAEAPVQAGSYPITLEADTFTGYSIDVQ